MNHRESELSSISQKDAISELDIAFMGGQRCTGTGHKCWSSSGSGGRCPPCYVEGDVVSGDIVVELREDTVIEAISITLQGVARVDIRRDRHKKKRKKSPNRERRSKQTQEKYLNQTLALYTRGEVSSHMLVKAGRHRYPFSIQLPIGLPSSVRGSYGSIKYIAKAAIESPWHPKLTYEKEFRVKSLVDLSTFPQALQPINCSKTQDQGVLSCCFMGSITARWLLERMGYICGESVHIMAEITNRSRLNISKIKIILVQHLQYYEPPNESLTERRQVAQIERDGVNFGKPAVFEENLVIPDLPPTGLKGCKIMDLSYTLKMRIVPSGISDSIETKTDIIIATKQAVDGAENQTFTGFTPPFKSSETTSSTQDIALNLDYFI